MSQKVVRRDGINTRALASLALFCAGVWLVPSGIALHFASHKEAATWIHFFMSMHNAASFIFLIAAIVHVILNWKAMSHYMKAKAGEYVRFKRELLIAVLAVSGFVLLAAYHAFHIP
jgi:hypothetical protein